MEPRSTMRPRHPTSRCGFRFQRPPAVGSFGPKTGFVADATLPLMDTPAQYFDLGFIHISDPNLFVIGLMIVLFAIALVAPFPHGGEGDA